MRPLTQVSDPISEGQVKLVTRIIGDVADSDPVQKALAGLSKKGAERLKGNPKFVETLRKKAVEAITEFSVVNEFANEEVESNYGYLSGYKKPMGLNEQCNQLRILFPGIGYANQDLLTRIEKGEVKLPQHAEGWFAIPNWKKNPKLFGSTYSEAVQTVLNAINKSRNGMFYNYCNGQIDEKHLRQSARSQEFWNKLIEERGNPDILIIPAQLGIRHRGRSVRRARVIMEDTRGEVGLGSFAVGIMLLTHPERLQNCDDLWIDLAGDEWSPDADGDFSVAPFFSFYDGKVEFDTRSVDDADDYYGSASWFSPQ